MATAKGSHARILDSCHDTVSTKRTVYRPSKRPPKGAWARHLQEQRRLRDLSAVEAFERVHERIGWSPKSRTAYVAIDSGDRQPRGIEVTVLGEEFGWPPDPLDAEPSEDATMAAALLAVMGELRAVREERAAVAARLEQMEAVLDGLVERAMRGGSERPVPDGSAG
jgi:hypothetical protein